MEPYEPGFYRELQETSVGSAQVVVPRVLDLVRPASVVDVGCGTGGWLREFLDAGVGRGLGLDGEWVDTSLLQIPKENFRRQELTQSFPAVETFDLAVSLEVAEHLPPDAASHFVASLIQLAPVVLFSAAAPGQGGYKHLNEQWPAYWAQLFSQHGYELVDCLRPEFWNNEQVEYWYAQNMMFYVRGSMAQYPALAAAERERSFGGRAMVHPTLYQIRMNQLSNPGIVQSVKSVPRAIARSVRYRITKGK